MSQYYYKGINLNQIVVNNGNTTPQSGYYNFPQSTFSYNYSIFRPSNFDYLYQNNQLANSSTTFTANYSNVYFSSSNNVSIPSGCKSMNIIAVGGGGGGGGAGGGVSIQCGCNGKGNTANGGAGSPGGYGSYFAGNVEVGNNTKLNVIIGQGGGGGGGGSGNSAKSNFSGANFDCGNNQSTTGGTGGDGGAGTASYIQFSDGNIYAKADGGNGGGGGNGAYGYANNSTNSYGGNSNDSPGSPSNSQYAGGPNYYPQFYQTVNIPFAPSFTVENGVGGGGGNSGGGGGSGGSGGGGWNGAMQIIWLYD